MSNITIPLVVCPSLTLFLAPPSKNRSFHLRGAGFAINGFEFSLKNKNIYDGIIINYRPKDAQVSQMCPIPLDAILGERRDWRGTLRAGGVFMVMNLTGNENFQLRYEDENSKVIFPKIDGEPNNRPGKGHFERLTNDSCSHRSVVVSLSSRLLSQSHMSSILAHISLRPDC
jgi:hypothetical protein